MTGVLLPSYSAALISHLAVDTPMRPFNSLEEMVEKQSQKLTAAYKAAEFSFFSVSGESWF